MPEAKKSLLVMTKEDFAKLPRLEDDAFEGFNPMKDSFRSLVIIPTGEEHDSGFGCMEFVLVNAHGEAICRVSGSSDVVHIDGIGGYGVGSISKAQRLIDGTPIVIPKGWSIDCLPCGYLRLFAGGDYDLVLERPYWPSSSFEIFAEKRKNK